MAKIRAPLDVPTPPKNPPPPKTQAQQWAEQGKPAQTDANDDFRVVTEDPIPERPKWPKLQPNAMYWLWYNPLRWDAVEDGQGGREVIPVFARVVAEPGANGVSRVERPGGKFMVDVRHAFDNITRNIPGAYILPHDIDGRSYLRSYQVGVTFDAKTGAEVRLRYWCTRWETCYPGIETVTTDAAGYARWCRQLVESGRLPPPPMHVLDRLEAEYRSRYDRAAHKHGASNPEHVTIRAHVSALAAIRAERARLMELAEPAQEDTAVADDVLVPE